MSRLLRWTVLVGVVLGLVITPWLVWGPQIEAQVTAFAQSREVPPGAALLVVGLLAADILLPVPSSFVAVAAGVFMGTVAGALLNTLGLTLGCVVGYVLGLKGGYGGARQLVGPADWSRAERFAQVYGRGVLLALRPVPVLAEASVFFAGAARVPFAHFLATCLFANAVIGLVYAGAGALSAELGHLEGALMAGAALPLVAMVSARWVQRRFSPNGNGPVDHVDR